MIKASSDRCPPSRSFKLGFLGCANWYFGMATFDFRTVESQLRKRSTFESGVQSLESFFSGPFVSASDAERRESLRLVSRTFTLLQSRYSGLPFWKAGERLFGTAKVND